jgi:HlyD family secretion protein
VTQSRLPVEVLLRDAVQWHAGCGHRPSGRAGISIGADGRARNSRSWSEARCDRSAVLTTTADQDLLGCWFMTEFARSAHAGLLVPAAEAVERNGDRAVPPAKKQRPGVRWNRALRWIVVVVVAVIASAMGHRLVTRPRAVLIGRVEVGTVRAETFGPGTVQSRFSVSIASRITGTVERVLVDVGDQVDRGQPLAVLDPTELQARLRAAEASVASARKDIALAGASLGKADADFRLARIVFQRAQRLVAAGALTLEDFDKAEGAFTASAASQRAAQLGVEARRADLARLAQERQVADTVLSYTALRSPMPAVVIRRALEPGSAVAPGSVLFQLVDPNALWVATLLDQSLSRMVQVGQSAAIRLRSGGELTGHVARISFEADPVTRELEVDVAFDMRPSRFAIHEEADVTIFGDAVRGLLVPLGALSRGPDGDFVFVVEEGRTRHRLVRLGVVGASRAQIIDGLRAGESVVLSPGAVRDGDRVVAAGSGGG